MYSLIQEEGSYQRPSQNATEQCIETKWEKGSTTFFKTSDCREEPGLVTKEHHGDTSTFFSSFFFKDEIDQF